MDQRLAAGASAREEGDVDAAIASYEAAVGVYDAALEAQDRSGYNYVYILQSRAAFALLTIGDLLSERGEEDAAIRAYHETSRFGLADREQGDSEDWVSRRLALTALVRKGELLARRGDRDGARETYETGMAIANAWPPLEVPAREATVALERLKDE
jgi:tetratricopeptide (TPR) repeat protein